MVQQQGGKFHRVGRANQRQASCREERDPTCRKRWAALHGGQDEHHGQRASPTGQAVPRRVRGGGCHGCGRGRGGGHRPHSPAPRMSARRAPRGIPASGVREAPPRKVYSRSPRGRLGGPMKGKRSGPALLRPAGARLIAIGLCALFLLPVATAAVLPSTGVGAGIPARAPPSGDLTGPYQPLPMRVPDPSQLGSAAGRRAGEPAQLRTPLASGVANWTVLVYMVADNDLEPFAIQDINEMEAAAPSSAVQIAIEVDRSPRYDTSNGDWSSTRRYRILHDANSSTISSLPLADLGEVDMGDPQALADFLSWGVDAYPASHYLVVLWDHGYGWSGGFGNDLTDGDHLSLAEVREGLTQGARHLGRPFDVLGFDACLMQQVDVLFELSGVADYFVGAEDLEPAAGWVYDEM